ncbi:MAG: hypothetical protein ACRD0U_20960, partial [Acidimicrobiales bacterium]
MNRLRVTAAVALLIAAAWFPADRRSGDTADVRVTDEARPPTTRQLPRNQTTAPSTAAPGAATAPTTVAPSTTEPPTT